MTPVFVLEAPNNRSKYAVAYVTGRTGEGIVSFEDVREMIRNLLTKQLGEQRYVQQLRQAAYVDVRGL